MSNAPTLKLGLPASPVVPQSVMGTYRRLKWGLHGACLAVYYALPFLRWDRGPGRPGQAIMLDLANARFHLFGLEIRPQELYYLTVLLVLATVVLVLANALAGRVWCGFFCPQTVWSDLFMLVERRIEGDRRDRLRKLGQPLTARRIGEIALKHALWLIIAAATGGAIMLYFADAPTLVRELLTGTASSAAVMIIAVFTGLTYALAGFGREKVCTYMCPWPRLQGAIWDPEALTVNYRDHRGEERMSVKKAAAARAAGKPAGDCVDCAACVNVCPMGIDIRQGPNIACINCGLCVDACDGTMEKLGRARGLIDYETWTNIERGRTGEARQPARPFRPKVLGLAAAVAAIVAGLAVSVSTRAGYEIAVSHDKSPLGVALSDGRIRNGYEFRLTNSGREPLAIQLTVEGRPGATLAVSAEPGSEAGALPLKADPSDTEKVRVSVFAPDGPTGDIAFVLRDGAGSVVARLAERFHRP
ncbi:cytochrome c oxidase accessory protein CcoG [Prosthecomicrobium sp. N25]|uniref:cytochrome c oxidase accessory protein CcoG n=1 Tax=Prosthecomicrobium sp. N25 TaxID=3129254 RepID=UPI00307770CB